MNAVLKQFFESNQDPKASIKEGDIYVGNVYSGKFWAEVPYAFFVVTSVENDSVYVDHVACKITSEELGWSRYRGITKYTYEPDLEKVIDYHIELVADKSGELLPVDPEASSITIHYIFNRAGKELSVEKEVKNIVPYEKPLSRVIDTTD